MEMLKMENKMLEINNLLERFNSKLDIVMEKISEFEER